METGGELEMQWKWRQKGRWERSQWEAAEIETEGEGMTEEAQPVWGQTAVSPKVLQNVLSTLRAAIGSTSRTKSLPSGPMYKEMCIAS